MDTMQALFSKTDWERLPEGFPAELVAGQLVRDPSPTFGHQSVQMRLLRMLMPLVAEDLLVAAPSDVLVDAHNIFQPDILVLETAPPGDEHYVGTPLATFEVLSPSTLARDRDQKAPRLIALGVREVWLVDPTAATIERRTQTGTRIAVGEETISSDVVTGFAICPLHLFRPSRA